MKKSLCVIFIAVMLVLSLIPTSFASSAVKAEDYKSGTTVTLDSMNYGEKDVVPWNVSDGGESVDIKSVSSEEPFANGKCLEFTVKSEKSALIFREFSPAADLAPASGISFYFYGENPKPEKTKKGEEETVADCRIVLTVYSGENHTSMTQNCNAGEWQVLSFDISDLRYRSSVDRIEISVRFFTDTERENDVFRIASLFGSKAVDSGTYYRFLSDNFTTAVGSEKVEDGILNFDTVKDGFLSSTMPILCDSDVNGIWLKLNNKSTATSLSVTCLSDSETSVSDSNTVTVQISAAEGNRVYFAVLPAIGNARKIVITLPQNDAGYEGIIEFSAINPVKLAEKSAQSRLGSLTSVTLLSDGKSVKASGTMTAEAVVKYSGKSIGLYCISDAEDRTKIADGSLAPLASIPVSMRFDIRAKLTDADETSYCNRFIVAVVGETDDDGNIVTVGQERYISVLSDTVNPDAKFGISAKMTASSLGVDADMTVIEVDCGKFRAGDGVGTFYRSGDEFRYYNTAYITELDRKISSTSCDGDVLLRLVMTSENFDSSLCSFEDGTPILTASDSVRRDNIAMLTAFLADRYKIGSEYGEIDGMILGYAADEYADSESLGGLSRENYVSLCLDTLMTVSTAAGSVSPRLEFYISVGDRLGDSSPMFGGGRSLLFLDSFTKAASKYGKFSFGFCFESDGVSLAELENCLTYLSDMNGVSAAYIMYSLTPNGANNVRQAAGMYLDMTAAALSSTKLHRLVLNLNESDLAVFLPVLSAKTESDFETILGSADEAVVAEIELVINSKKASDTFTADTAVPAGTVGSYAYFDFTASYDSGDFEAGDGCVSLSSGTGDAGRALVAEIEVSEYGKGGFFRRFSTPEDIGEIDALSFKVSAEKDCNITVVLGDGERSVAYYAVLSNGNNIFYCNLNKWQSSGKLKYIRILSDTDNTLKLEKIIGISRTKTDSELAEIVDAARYDGGGKEKESTPVLGRVELAIALLSLLIISVSALFILGRKK